MFKIILAHLANNTQINISSVTMDKRDYVFIMFHIILAHLPHRTLSSRENKTFESLSHDKV